MDMRRGLLGKGAFLVTTVEAGAHIAGDARQVDHGNILGMSPPDPPPNVPPLPPRRTDATGNAKEPTMRQKMLDHRVRADCIQCHSMMDPDRLLARELRRRSRCGGRMTRATPIDPASQVFDGTKIDGPAGLRKWLIGYSISSCEVAPRSC